MCLYSQLDSSLWGRAFSHCPSLSECQDRAGPFAPICCETPEVQGCHAPLEVALNWVNRGSGKRDVNSRRESLFLGLHHPHLQDFLLYCG